MAKKRSADQIMQISGGAIAAALIGYLVVSYTWFNDAPVGCMDGYQQAIRFGLQNSDGLPLSTIELQAQAGPSEQGLMQNAKVVNAESAPMPRVLEVKLGRADASNVQSPIGVHFPWRPESSHSTNSACLRYSVRLPENFDFAHAGTLPGLFGGPAPDRFEQAGAESGFALRTRWGKDGDAQFVAESKAVGDNGRYFINRPGTIRLASGHWVTLEQELKMNTPGQRDGEMHVWMNGKKVVEKKGLKLREEDTFGIDGVAVTIGLSGKPQDVPESEARLMISPIDYGWK